MVLSASSIRGGSHVCIIPICNFTHPSPRTSEEDLPSERSFKRFSSTISRRNPALLLFSSSFKKLYPPPLNNYIHVSSTAPKTTLHVVPCRVVRPLPNSSTWSPVVPSVLSQTERMAGGWDTTVDSRENRGAPARPRSGGGVYEVLSVGRGGTRYDLSRAAGAGDSDRRTT